MSRLSDFSSVGDLQEDMRQFGCSSKAIRHAVDQFEKEQEQKRIDELAERYISDEKINEVQQ